MQEKKLLTINIFQTCEQENEIFKSAILKLAKKEVKTGKALKPFFSLFDLINFMVALKKVHPYSYSQYAEIISKRIA